MPYGLRLDVYEVAWERRVAESTRQTAHAGIPFNGSSNSVTMDINSMSSAGGPASFKFMVTVPDIDKSLWTTQGTLTANMQGQSSTSPGWNTIESQFVTSTLGQNTNGFQFLHQNANLAYDQFRLEMENTGGSLQMTNVVAFVDGIYNGNQRRRVENIVATTTTNHFSTVSTEYDNFIDKVTITDPVFYVSDNNVEKTDNGFDSKPMRPVIFNGVWKVDRISAERGEGRSAEVLVSLTQEGSWIDE
jgi:hypothetical protein